MISQDSTTSKRSGPPPTSSTEQVEVQNQEMPESANTDQSTFEPAGNGYFYRKMHDGTYEQVIYVQSADGTYVPYQQ